MLMFIADYYSYLFEYMLSFMDLKALAYLRCVCQQFSYHPLIQKSIEERQGKEGRFMEHNWDGCNTLGARISMLQKCDFFWKAIEMDHHNDLHVEGHGQWVNCEKKGVWFRQLSYARDCAFKDIRVCSPHPITVSIGSFWVATLPSGNYEKELFSRYICPKSDLRFHDITFEPESRSENATFSVECKVHRWQEVPPYYREMFVWICGEKLGAIYEGAFHPFRGKEPPAGCCMPIYFFD